MNRLRDLRKSRGMTLEELGKMINIQKSTVAKYEKGTVEMSTSILEKLSNVFNVSIDYIVNNPNANLLPPPPPNEKDFELVAISKNLDSENYKVAVKVLRLLAENTERNKQQHFSDDEVSLINDYRALDEGRKQRARGVVEGLRLAVDNSRQAHLPLGSNDHVEVGTIAAPTNITATQNVGVPK